MARLNNCSLSNTQKAEQREKVPVLNEKLELFIQPENYY